MSISIPILSKYFLCLTYIVAVISSYIQSYLRRGYKIPNTMTFRYAHLAPTHKVKAVNILDSVINKNASTSHLLHKLPLNV